MIDTSELKKAAGAVFLATEESVAQDLSGRLNEAAKVIDEFRSGESDITDDIVEQSLLDNIDLTLTAAEPTREELDRTHVAVLAYKEFQQALVAKIERDGY